MVGCVYQLEYNAGGVKCLLDQRNRVWLCLSPYVLLDAYLSQTVMILFLKLLFESVVFISEKCLKTDSKIYGPNNIKGWEKSSNERMEKMDLYIFMPCLFSILKGWRR